MQLALKLRGQHGVHRIHCPLTRHRLGGFKASATWIGQAPTAPKPRCGWPPLGYGHHFEPTALLMPPKKMACRFPWTGNLVGQPVSFWGYLHPPRRVRIKYMQIYANLLHLHRPWWDWSLLIWLPNAPKSSQPWSPELQRRRSLPGIDTPVMGSTFFKPQAGQPTRKAPDGSPHIGFSIKPTKTTKPNSKQHKPFLSGAAFFTPDTNSKTARPESRGASQPP